MINLIIQINSENKEEAKQVTISVPKSIYYLIQDNPTLILTIKIIIIYILLCSPINNKLLNSYFMSKVYIHKNLHIKLILIPSSLHIL